MSTDGSSIVPTSPLRPRLVITGQGPGVITADLGNDRYEVTIDGEERPFALERREIQPVLPWLVVQVINLTRIQLPDNDGIVRMQHLANASFATDEEVAYWLKRTRAENEVAYGFNLATGEVAIDQGLPFLEQEAPLLHLDCWINLWLVGEFNCFPPELAKAAWAEYCDCTSSGTVGHIHLSAFLDLAAKRLLAVQIETCMRVAFGHRYDQPEPQTGK